MLSCSDSVRRAGNVQAQTVVHTWLLVVVVVAPAGSPGLLPVCRAHHRQVALGNRLCHLRTAAHLHGSEAAGGSSTSSSSSRDQQCSPGWPSGPSSSRCQSRLAAVAAAADCWSSIPGSSDTGVAGNDTSSSSTLQPLAALPVAYQQQPGTAAQKQPVQHASRSQVEVAAAESMQLPEPQPTSCSSTGDIGAASSGSRQSSSTSSSSNTSSSSSSSSSSGRQLDDELGKYSYRMIISYDGTAYSGWQLQAPRQP